jgi:prolipoprotein diacylglyceryltransferase
MSAFRPGYLLFVGIGVLIAFAFPVTRHIKDSRLRRQYYIVQGFMLLGAIIGAKLSVLLGDYNWPWVPMKDWANVLWSGRSITGALILGFLFAELAKPLVGYTLPPNDRFAALIPFTIGIGRIGCMTAGCCGGIPYDGWCSLAGPDGIPRYPTQLFEFVFQIVVGISFVLMVRRQILFGRLFSLYLILYGTFRFFTEFVRDTPKFYDGYSGYQVLSLVMIVLGTAVFLKRTLAMPRNWMSYRSAPTAKETIQPKPEPSHV